MILYSKRRLVAGLLLSAALLSGCAPRPSESGGEAESSGQSGSAVSSADADTSQVSGEQIDRSGAASDASPVEGTTSDAALEGGQNGQLPEGAGKTLPSDQEEQPASGSASLSSYDFTQPCPESPAVDNSYFEDAAFIGDSRTDGFMIYSGIGCGENLTSNGLSIFKLAEKKALTIDGQKYTLLEALALKQYGKVYLSLGVNELGYYNDKGFYEAYCQAIDAIRACQPNAVIYIQGLIPLNENVIAATGGADYLTNEHLRIYNDLMKQAAQEKQVVFLDLNPEFTGPDGQLPAEASNDGVHLKKAYCQAWLEYLKTHTVSYETLYPTQEAQV